MLFKIAGGVSGFLIAVLASIKILAQEKTVQTDINIDNDRADPGFVTGSPWLWLLFVLVCIVVIVVLLKKRRNT